MSKELTAEVVEVKPQVMSIFTNMQSFNDAQRMAQVLAKSNIVPASYQNNLPNVIVALEIANRVGVSPFMVMQNLDIIKGKPSWSSTFIIAVLNSCGRFKPLRFRFEGEGADYGCIAYTYDGEGKLLESPKVDWKMVKAEGWSDKAGSKWKTMPDLMFHYRAASFFGRLYAPDILKGMQSSDEVIDVVATKVDDMDIDEERERILKFIDKCNTLKELAKIKSQLGGELYSEYEKEFTEKENEIILLEELNKSQNQTNLKL